MNCLRRRLRSTCGPHDGRRSPGARGRRGGATTRRHEAPALDDGAGDGPLLAPPVEQAELQLRERVALRGGAAPVLGRGADVPRRTAAPGSEGCTVSNSWSSGFFFFMNLRISV